jgi:hypothetical protein
MVIKFQAWKILNIKKTFTEKKINLEIFPETGLSLIEGNYRDTQHIVGLENGRKFSQISTIDICSPSYL